MTIIVIYLLWYGIYDGLLYGYTLYLAQSSLQNYTQFSDTMMYLQENNEWIVGITRSLSFGYVAYQIGIYLLSLGNIKLESFSKKSYLVNFSMEFIKKNWRVFSLSIVVEDLANSSNVLVLLLYFIINIFIIPFFLICAVDGKKGVKESLNFNFSLLKVNKVNLLVYFVILFVSPFLWGCYENLVFFIMKSLPDGINIILSVVVDLIVGIFVNTYFTIMMVELYKKAKEKYELKISDQKI